MSEISNTKEVRVARLKELSIILLETGNALPFITANKEFIPTVVPSDFIALFDEIILEGYPMVEIKVLTNKLLNIFHVTIRDYPRLEPEPESFLGILVHNNSEMEQRLHTIRRVFKAFVKDTLNTNLGKELLGLFQDLEIFVKHYTVKENVLFPLLEKSWPDYRCLQIMWSFHDEIRRNLKSIVQQLESGSIDSKVFNRCVGDIFFQMLAIKTREELILFPHILTTIDTMQLNALTKTGMELGFPYINPTNQESSDEPESKTGDGIDLGTGQINAGQIKLIFNHLPVDITFVDENNSVRYFSYPEKRIFPRAVAIIGRQVQNCHPPESVHIVNEIVEAFRNGTKNHADFWIQMKERFIHIRYFAIRDEKGTYKGTLEVSQDVTEIRALKGEQRLLDWGM